MGTQLSYYKKRQQAHAAQYQLPEPVEKMLTQLRMPALKTKACAHLAGLTPKRQQDFEDFLADICGAEVASRAKSALDQRRKSAGLPTGVSFDHWDSTRSTIPLQAQQDLRTLAWMKTNYNLVICGPHGTGKSMFVELLASEAITCGKKVKWLTMEHLGDIVAKNPLTVARTKAFNQLAKRDLIIIDDIGLLDITTEQAEGFLRLITATYANTSVATTSNYHPSNFDEIMPIKHTQ